MKLLEVGFVDNEIKEQFKNFIKRKQLKDKIKGATITSYDISNRKFFKYLSDNDLQLGKLNDKIALDYIEYLLSQYKRSTANTRIKDVKAFLDYLVTQDMLIKAQYGELSKLKVSKGNKPALNENQRESLIESIRGSKLSMEKRFRNLAIIYLDICTGLRVSELVLLKVSDVNFANKMLSVYRPKTEKQDTLPIADDCIEYLEMNIDINNLEQEDYLFVSSSKKTQMSVSGVQKMYAKYAKQCFKNDQLHGIHTLRRTFATKMFKNGVDIYRISRLLSHSNVQTTIDYIDAESNTTKHDYEAVNNIF